MAYLFHDAMFTGAAPCAGIELPALSPIEARVVELALADGPSTLATAPWRRSLAAMLGLRPAKPLASPRLEALRRFACAAVIGGASLQSATAGLLQAGYTPAHVELAQAAVTSR